MTANLMRWALLYLAIVTSLQAQAGGSLAAALASLSMDPAECYRVRDISLVRDEARTYFNEGYLIFAQPVAGHRAAAVFVAGDEGGDAELLLLPPTKAERRSLAAHAKTPNLDEHFTQALLLFGDATYEELMRQIRAAPRVRKAPDEGAALAAEWTPVARTLSGAFATRTTLELLSPGSGAGFFTAILNTRGLGTIDLLFDPRSIEQIILGQLRGGERAYFETWTSFQARSFRLSSAAPDVVAEHYRIDATLDPRLRLRCVSTLTVRLPAEARAVPLEISSQMAVTAAAVDGQPATIVDSHAARTDLTQDSGDRMFLVVPAHPLSASAAHEIRVEHEGDVVSAAEEGVFFVGSRGRWYPHRGAQFATFDVTYHYNRGVDLVSPGDLLSDRVEGEVRSVRRVITVPVPFLGFNLGAYTCLNRIAGQVTVKVCASHQLEDALRAHMKTPARRLESAASGGPERLQTLAEEVAGAMQFYAAHFGPPPLRELVAAPIAGTFGQGFAGLIYLSAFTYLNEADPAMVALNPRLRFFFRDLLQAHEAAHQWWGNSVSAASYRDEWLMEALANYSAILWLESRKGPDAVHELLSNYRDQLLAHSPAGERIEAAGPVTQGRRLESPANPRAYDLILYGKGTWIIHMLRERMGDAAFWQVLAQVLAEYRHKTISTEQFRHVCAQHMPAGSSDRGLETFFEQWVDATGVPELALTSSVKNGPRGYTVSGRVTQTDVDETFQTEVPVVVQPERGAAVVRWIVTGPEPVSFSMLVPTRPARVALDPDFSVLRR